MPDPYREITNEAPEKSPEKSERVENLPEAEQIASVEKENEKTGTAEISMPSVASEPSLKTGTAPLAPTPNDIEKDRQLKILVDLAFAEGIDKAVEAARETENAYLIDKLHDTLADELSEKLKNQGKLKEI